MKIKVVLVALGLAVTFTGVKAQSVPALTTDDVIHSRTPSSTHESKPVGTVGKSASTGSSTTESQETQAEKDHRVAQRAWNERLRAARDRQRDLLRRADQAELEANRLRNVLFDPTRPQRPEDSTNLNIQIDKLLQQAKSLRAEAQAVQEVIDGLLDEGEAKKYQIEEIALEKKNGDPNVSGYKQKVAELQTELNDAQARVDVLQLRINFIRAEQRRNEGGDNFYLRRLKDERADLTAELEQVKARIVELTQEISQLRQRAAIAGVPPGLLR
ncbi:MAG TPA: hypothetical protein VEF04_01750 [Blastocatellia bacterium]|nr:hypothetical protein [Blastocatellia bacterium]